MELAFLPFGFFVFFVFNVPPSSFRYVGENYPSFYFSLRFVAYSIGFLKFFLIDTLREIIIFFLFWRSLRNELEKVGVKGYTKNDRPDLHMKSSIFVPAFPVSRLWTIIRPQQIFCRSRKLIRTTIHYDWMYRLSVAVSAYSESTPHSI